jgi:hypothetical protein
MILGFNEASAEKTGDMPSEAQEAPPAQQASMRPQQKDRGYDPRRVACRPQSAGFNEAPAERPGIFLAISRQCGLLYFTLGQYAFIVVSDMPDAKAVSMLAFVAAGGGATEGSVTTQTFTTAEAREMFAAAGKIAGDYKPMGAS